MSLERDKTGRPFRFAVREAGPGNLEETIDKDSR